MVAATTRERSFKQALIEQARLAPRHKVLDLAAGTGTLAVWMKRSQPSIELWAIDGDREILGTVLRKAQRAAVDINFDCALSHPLPYPDAHFDRVVSSLFFHHLSWEGKERTAREIFRVLKPGGELHVADWGRPSNLVMRGAFVTVQLLDGFENTRHNATGRLPGLFDWAGFAAVAQRRTFDTICGTMALYSAAKSADAAALALPSTHYRQLPDQCHIEEAK